MKHDITPLGMDNNKTLVAEANALEQVDNSGKYVFHVRGPPWDRKVVWLTKRERSQVTTASTQLDEVEA